MPVPLGGPFLSLPSYMWGAEEQQSNEIKTVFHVWYNNFKIHMMLVFLKIHYNIILTDLQTPEHQT